MFDKACKFLRERGVYLSPQDLGHIQPLTRCKVVPKHTIIMHQGKPVTKLYFLNSGIVHLFRTHQGIDHTLGIVSSNEFVSTPLYLLNGQPSSCALETLTEVEVLEWGKPQVEEIKRLVPKAYDMELVLMDRVLNWVQDHQIDAHCLTAEERYHKIMQQQPEILNTIPLKYVASLLGIHQDSLSRIRKQYGQKMA